MNYLGCDPGAQGYFAVVGNVVEAHPLKGLDHGDILRLLMALKARHNLEYCLLELITPIPGFVEKKINEKRALEGKQPISLSHMNAKLNQSYAALKMALTAAEFKTCEMRPVDWQRLLGVKKSKGQARPDFKRRLRDKAQSLFPRFKVHLEMADAILLAELCRRLRTHENGPLFEKKPAKVAEPDFNHVSNLAD
jgi:hypothetical protein